jgi:hypothetical protein
VGALWPHPCYGQLRCAVVAGMVAWKRAKDDDHALLACAACAQMHAPPCRAWHASIWRAHMCSRCVHPSVLPALTLCVPLCSSLPPSAEVLESSRFDDFESFMAAVQALWDAQWQAVHSAPQHGEFAAVGEHSRSVCGQLRAPGAVLFSFAQVVPCLQLKSLIDPLPAPLPSPDLAPPPHCRAP